MSARTMLTHFFLNSNPVKKNLPAFLFLNDTADSGSVFMVDDVDILAGTPLHDTKSRIPASDSIPDKKAGNLIIAAIKSQPYDRAGDSCIPTRFYLVLCA